MKFGNAKRNGIHMLAGVLLLIFSFLFDAAAADAAVTVGDGQYVFFGRWNHAKGASSGYEGVEMPILWQKKADGLYLSEYLVDAQSWHSVNVMPTGEWKGSKLYSWLGETFYPGAFSEFERGMLRLEPDGAEDVYVTIPNTTTDDPEYASTSLFGKRHYKSEGASVGQRYWLRKRYKTTTDRAWGVGVNGFQGGDAVMTDVIGVAPIISLNTDAMILKTGAGTAGDPYVLYGTSDGMKPAELSVEGDILVIVLGTAVEALEALPAAGDFSVLKNGESAAVSGAALSGTNAKALELQLGESAEYGDVFTVSYTLQSDAGGLLAGGALKAVSENSVMKSFSGLQVKNEAPATVGNIEITPAPLQAVAYRAFSAEVTVSDSTGGTIVLNDVTASSGWNESNLDFSVDKTNKKIMVQGTPEIPGGYTLKLDVTIGGTRITDGVVRVDVVSPGTNPTADSLIVTPDKPGPLTLRSDADVTYTVSSAIADSRVEFIAARGDADWSSSGLAFVPSYYPAGNMLAVRGIPRKTGSYKLFLDARIDGTLISGKEVVVEVVYPATNPTPADVLVTSDLSGALVVGKYAGFSYTVGSSIKDAEVVLESVRGGVDWAQSGMTLVPNLAGNKAAISGTPLTAGTYTVVMDIRIDGVLLEGYEQSFIVGNPLTAADLTFTPGLPRAKAHRSFSAATEIGSRTGDSVTLNDVTAGSEWIESGMSFSFDKNSGRVSVSGVPNGAGTYSLKLDATLGDVRITNGVLRVEVDPVDSNPTAANVTIVPGNTDGFVVRKAANTEYTVTTGIADARLKLVTVGSVQGWDASGLHFAFDSSRARFSVFGTPTSAGTYKLTMDIEIDGTLIEDYRMDVVVANAPATAADLTFTPAMPHAKARRPFEATTQVGSRTGEAVVLNGVRGGNGWEDSGMSFSFDGTAGTLTVRGKPNNAGVFTLHLDVTVGEERIRYTRLLGRSSADERAQIADGLISVSVDPLDSIPTADNVMIVPTTTENLVVNRPADMEYKVMTGITGAVVDLLEVRASDGWGESGLDFAYDVSNGTFSVFGTPVAVGTYKLAMDIEIDGTLIGNYTINIVVVDETSTEKPGTPGGENPEGENPGDGNPGGENPADEASLTFTPELPHAKAYRFFAASTTIGSTTGETVVLNDVRAGNSWEKSGMMFSFDPESGTVTVAGMPTETGTYVLWPDVSVGEKRITNRSILVRVDPSGSKPTADNVVIVPSTTHRIVAGRPANIEYRVTTGIAGAHVKLLEVRSGSDWQKSGLELSYDASNAKFQVFGTPVAAGIYRLVMDIEIDGTPIKGFSMNVVVVEDSASGGGGEEPGEELGGGGDSGGCSVLSAGALLLLLPGALFFRKRTKK